MNATFYRKLAALLADELARAPNERHRDLWLALARDLATALDRFAPNSFSRDKFLAAVQNVDKKLAGDADVLSRIARL